MSGLSAINEAHIMPVFASTIDHVTASAEDLVKLCCAYALCTTATLTSETAQVLRKQLAESRDPYKQLTYKKPSRNTPTSATFCLRGSFSLNMVGTGNISTAKSSTILTLVVLSQ